MAHHRDHALAHIATASNHLENAQNLLATYVASAGSSGDPHGFHQTFQRNLAGAWDDLVDVAILLGDPAKSLDLARRKLTRPAIAGSPATINHMKYMVNFLSQITESATDGDRMALMDCMRNVSQSWEFVNMATWHINDGIREEIYNDSAFA